LNAILIVSQKSDKKFVKLLVIKKSKSDNYKIKVLYEEKFSLKEAISLSKKKGGVK